MAMLSKKLVASTILAALIATSICADVINEHLKNNEYRLPTSIRPKAYTIHLANISFNQGYFNGVVNIDAEVTEATDKIVLNKGKLLKIKKTVVLQNDFEIDLSDIPTDDLTTEYFTIMLEKKLKPLDKITISLSFSGNLRADIIEIYRSAYFHENNNTK